MGSANNFRAYLVTKTDGEKATGAIVTRTVNDLPPGDVLIRVAYSSLNYKDGLSATGSPGVTKNYPHVPGIDAAGEVAESQDSRYAPGDYVLVTGYDLGANTDGGYSEYIRVPGEWVVPLPKNLSLHQCMMIGTAGFTAAIGVSLIQRNGVLPDSGEVVVTGATGGVGSIAVALLAKLGYRVVASTGKSDAHDFLMQLGATRIIDRSEMEDISGRPLLKSVWAGGIDTVGGNTLTTLIKSVNVQGSVAACGVVAGPKLDLTVFPFILRGVNLLGIDSALWPREPRHEIWRKFASDWKLDVLETISQTIVLDDVEEYVGRILKGKIQGRIVIKM
ncbi:MAG: YhdH/YhfP family quinone oxidoreductase [Candidatus Zhuqueibacterota bacterium]